MKATTCSCRNGSKLLADNVAFTGRPLVMGLMSGHAGACWLRLCVLYGVTGAVDAVPAAPS